MVLLIPKTVKSLVDRGRKEERKRMLSALREARARGIDPDSPEFERFLRDFQVDGSEDAR